MKPEFYFIVGAIYASPHMTTLAGIIVSTIFALIGAIKLICSAND